MYKGSGEKIRYVNPPVVSCGLALALANFDRVVNEEAKRELGQPVVRIQHLGTYACRKMARFPDWVSEHSYGNAIDIEAFVLKNGRKISVLGSYGDPAAEPKRPESRFLRTLAQRLFDEDVFSVVVTPAFDKLHKTHLHLDLARFRADGTRIPASS